MTAPIPEEQDQDALPTEGTPPGEHDDELSEGDDATAAREREQEHNAETSEDQPSQ
ncbi:hypothetical protein [Nocardioides acrostichi]|uniref:Uncharacterized protein n=1 Tax=Nocardioides acrostichi TaxID=2784339 RepID=A0A930UVK9_9ACTN|nr:hypothetical protein [Nocardioides acrostichi]MBF4161668.1 hypothetical protein [Nocardioides acrostichi]